ncbi:AraC family transcriptional regulator [Pedobacter sp. UYP1]|uniref:helix-turn-helix domain-containing protein n=1 Tax=Pedobacter sp. UYP1 TaxID=1756396 RepID=UPI003394C709
MDSKSLISIISLIAVFVSVLLSFFLLTVNSERKLGNVLLAGFILLNAIDLSAWFIYDFTKLHPDLELFRRSTSWLINPVFYLYALSICFSDFRLKAKHLLHALPFIGYNLLLLPKFYLTDIKQKSFFLEHYGDGSAAKIMLLAGHLQFACYFIGVFLVLRKYRKIYLENYADSRTITYKWLFQLTVVITVVHSIVTLKDILKFTVSTDVFNGAQIIVGINAVFILCWFILKALYYPDLFRGIDSTIQPAENLVLEDHLANQPIKGVLSLQDQKELQRIRDYMVQKEPYLEPALTIQDLANQINMPVKDLSILINNHLDQHFFDFVNVYRIEKAMKILKDPAKAKLTILEILYEIGFNSKSSFNTSFKKHTDLTPTEYRKKYTQ